jgi:uncharacterized protein with NAD-binding domain and iron-sulfur cluster
MAQRVVILGGGVAGLAAAFELTSEPGWQDRFAVTVYQPGWRLGGKGASARNLASGSRIEEHGLHVWFGCYHHAFRMLRACYEELGPRPGNPVGSIDRAFSPQDSTPFMEHYDGQWLFWPMTYHRNDGVPGVTRREATAWDHVKDICWLAEHEFVRMVEEWEQLRHRAPPPPDWLAPHVPPADAGSDLDSRLQQARRMVAALPADPAAHTPEHHHGILWLLREFAAWLRGKVTADLLGNLVLRRAFINVDLAVAALRGMIADGVLLHGYARLDDEDLRVWLARHGAHEITTWSAPVRALYDMCFAYEDGDAGDGTPANPGRPNFAAGAALYTMLRIALTYSGAVCYEMAAGMGEVVIAPLYQALRRRGVRFEFFSAARRLELDSGGSSIAAVHIGRQVKLTGDEYQPLVDVGGVPCWPAGPLLDQIEDGDALRGVDLESWWSGWRDREETVLRAGEHFDRVVLAVSLAGIAPIAGELAARVPRWGGALAHVKTVQTLAAQLWLVPPLAGTGWPEGPIPVDAAPEPLDVWADRSALLAREGWPPSRGPGSIQYLCGPLPGDYLTRPPTDPAVPGEALAAGRRILVTWLERSARVLWPTLAGDGSFDWEALYDPDGRGGEARLASQYLRANIDPTERYVLSVATSTRWRFAPHDTGLANLVAAGDWTLTPFNAGCIEGATISGMNAARALTGAAPLAG